jgi:threonine/homoserine/homoserine lactone efflux protein
MQAQEFTALLVLSTVTSFTPGPNTTLSTALAANLGLKRAMRFVVAVPVGWGLLFTLCAGGLGALVQADAAQLQVTFWQGVALQFLNIKAWMLALTVVAGWLAGRDDALARFAVLLPLMLAFGFSSNLLYATMGSLLRNWLAGPVVNGIATAQRLRWFNRGMAAMLVATAFWMARI